MIDFMVTWFYATVTDDDGETIFETDNRADLRAWANQHKEYASCTCHVAYVMDDDGDEQEDIGPLADYIDWLEPQRPPITVQYALLVAGIVFVLDKFRINGRLRPSEPDPF